MKMVKLSAVIAGAILLSACSTTGNNGLGPGVDPDALGSEEGVEVFGVEDSTIQAGEAQFRIVNGVMDEATALYYDDLKRVFYFDFDKARVSAEDMEELRKNAEFMKAFPSARIQINGHADERGTREYNIALGERRAKAVELILKTHGITNEVSVVSFGEEKPVMIGHEEASWSKNRRSEILYDFSNVGN